MKRKVLWVVGIGILILVLFIGVIRYIEARNHQTDPNWQIANEINKVENALKEVDEGYECQSISKVTHLPILILKEIPSFIIAVRPLTWKMSLGSIPGWT